MVLSQAYKYNQNIVFSFTQNDIHSFFVCTKLIRTLSLRFGQKLKIFWMLKSLNFKIVLKVKFWGSLSPFLTNNTLFWWLSVAIFAKRLEYMVILANLHKHLPFLYLFPGELYPRIKNTGLYFIYFLKLRTNNFEAYFVQKN